MAEAPLPLLDAPSARPVLTDMQARLATAGIAFRPPPAEPTTCCGRGCNGCVWEGWLAAANWWCEQALALLEGAPPGPISPAENPPGPAVRAAPGPDHPP